MVLVSSRYLRVLAAFLHMALQTESLIKYFIVSGNFHVYFQLQTTVKVVIWCLSKLPSAAVKSSPLCLRAGRCISSARVTPRSGKLLVFLPAAFRWEPEVIRKIRSAPKHPRENEIAAYHVSISIFLTVNWSKKVVIIPRLQKWQNEKQMPHLLSSFPQSHPSLGLLRRAFCFWFPWCELVKRDSHGVLAALCWGRLGRRSRVDEDPSKRQRDQPMAGHFHRPLRGHVVTLVCGQTLEWDLTHNNSRTNSTARALGFLFGR